MRLSKGPVAALRVRSDSCRQAPERLQRHVVGDGYGLRMAASEEVDSLALRKARGAFFTPHELCEFVAAWAIRSPEDTVLEPSCGEAAFLLSAGDRLTALGSNAPKLAGAELHAASARRARRHLATAGLTAHITTGDFFEARPEPLYDVVIGNPPYVRYQDFTGASRAASQRAALRAGVKLTHLASSWAAFTIHSALFVRPGGRLGLVVPAELLSVNYASEVREYLMRRFGRVQLVLFKQRVFPDVQEEVVLLMAEGTGPCSRLEVHQTDNASTLNTTSVQVSQWAPPTAAAKWTPSLVPPAGLSAYQDLVASPGTTLLGNWGETSLGAVTGNNGYFTLTPTEVRALGLSPSETVRITPPGSTHLRNLSLSRRDWEDLGTAGRATYLFRPGLDPSPGATSYIEEGQRNGVDQAYKCRVRRPWWRTPVLAPPDLFLTYMNAGFPQLAANPARLRHLNSVHGVYLRDELATVGSQLLPLVCLNSFTLLGAEAVGRAYGGGMLKIEPKEADLLPLPTPDVVASAAEQLLGLVAPVRVLLASGNAREAIRLVDDVLLGQALGLEDGAIRALERAREHMVGRRKARGRSSKGK
jgi:adenine-specific DNA-methyltransferase